MTFGLVLKAMALDDAQAQLSGTPEAMASHRDHVSVRDFICATAASGALGAESHSSRDSDTRCKRESVSARLDNTKR